MELNLVNEEHQGDLREEVITLCQCHWASKSGSSWVNSTFGIHFHLPVGHIVHTVLHAAEDPVELRCQHMSICEEWVMQAHGRGWVQIPWILRSPLTFSASTHPYELGYEARRSFLGHHERGRGIL